MNGLKLTYSYDESRQTFVISYPDGTPMAYCRTEILAEKFCQGVPL